MKFALSLEHIPHAAAVRSVWQRHLQDEFEFAAPLFDAEPDYVGSIELVPGFSRAYGEALRDAGIVVINSPPSETITAIRESHVRSALIAFLDEWAWCDPSVRSRLVSVLADVDPDPWRNRVRATAESADRTSLEELAASAVMSEQPPQLLRLLGARLETEGADGISFLRSIQERYPSDFWANYDLGFHISTSDPREAIGYFRVAVSLRADAAPAHFNLGALLYRTQRWDEAIRHFERALEIAPEHAATHVSLGLCLVRKGNLDGASTHFREAIRIDPNDAESHGFLAVALGMAGRMPEAITEYREALKIDPTVAAIHNNLAKALATTGDIDGAILEYEQAIQLNPRSATSHAGVAGLLRMRGRFRDAAAHLQQVVTIDPTNTDARRDLRGVLIRLGEPERVRDDWRRELADSPTDHETWNGYAELCLYLGNTSDYHQVCRNLLDRFGTTTDPYIAERTARTCLLLPASQETIGRAAALVDVALNADKTTYADWALPFFHFAQGLAEYRRGHFEAAIAIMDGKASHVLGPAPRLVMAMAQRRLGRSHEAKSTLAAAVNAYDWQRDNADNLDAWMHHILRREAEATILPILPEFLERRQPSARSPDPNLLNSPLSASPIGG